MENIQLLNPNIIKCRNPNIDFLRLISMFSIVVYHIIFHGKAILKFKSNKIRLLLILCNWHVSCFGLISGLVGNKIIKFSNIYYLWFIAVSYSLIFNILFNLIKYNILNKNRLIYEMFPIALNKYWYLTSYFGSFTFLPLINAGVSTFNQTDIKKCVYFIFFICIIWSYYYKDCFHQQNGKTPYSLLIFYLFGSYIKKYIFFNNHLILYRIIIIVICSFTFIYISILTLIINKNDNHRLRNIFRIEVNSFPMILQTLSIVIIISLIKFNQFISKIIAFVGPLIFDVYLIHENHYIRNYVIVNSFNNYSFNTRISLIFIIIFYKAIVILFVCIFIGYIRNFIFKISKIKKICIKIDLLTTKITHYFI